MLCKFNITQRGESHKKHDVPCQDYSDSFSVSTMDGTMYVVALVADGVGSEARSDEGSKIAVVTVANFLRQKLVGEERIDNMLELIEDAYEDALEVMLNWSHEQQEPFTKYATTLTVAVFDGSTLWYGHAGDDGIVVMRCDGSYEMVTERHEGELANSVIPFGVHHWQFGEVADVASCVLMTDGILDYCVGDQLERNRVRLPFLKPLLYTAWESEEELEAAREDWNDFLSMSRDESEVVEGGTPARMFRDIVRDDLSIALLSNSEAVANLPEYSFDLDAWNADSERFAEMRERELAGLERKRLEEDAAYRELVRVGKKGMTRKAHTGVSVTGRTPTTARNPRMPPLPDGLGAGPAEADGPFEDLSPSCAASDHEWSQTIADGAGNVMRGIVILGDVLGEAVKDLLRKP